MKTDKLEFVAYRKINNMRALYISNIWHIEGYFGTSFPKTNSKKRKTINDLRASFKSAYDKDRSIVISMIYNGEIIHNTSDLFQSFCSQFYVAAGRDSKWNTRKKDLLPWKWQSLLPN